MVDPSNKETFVDAEKDADDDVASPDSKELENISKMNVVTYRGFLLAGPISTNEVSFERARRAESIAG
ncbi:unnamed protein product [Meloidogyne enterolobii]|uniref:Uncharacterized protein n=1 Tax=Meloidogyne enterolobii TaxID=390850 RepID=A0ACB0YVH8_MELEN